MRLIGETRVGRRNVNQTGIGIERHRCPIVSAAAGRINRDRVLIVIRFGIHDRPAVLADRRRPTHFHERLGGDEFAGDTVQHIEETVLRRLHDHLAHAAVDVEIEQHQLLHVVEIPVVVGNGLVVPLELAGGEVDREDRARVQIVETRSAAKLLHPRFGVAGANVDEVRFGIVRESVPHGGAAAVLPEVTAPGFRRLAQRFAFVGLRRVARHGIEAPLQFACLRIDGNELSAGWFVAAGRADDHLAACDARRHR